LLTFIALAAIATGATLIVHHRQWSRGSAPNFVLVVIPSALLFVILPVAPLMLQTVRSTQPIGNSGTDFSAVGELCLQIERTLWWGTVAILGTMVVAALLQVAASATRPASARDGDPTHNMGAWIILIACTSLLLPTALLMFFVERVPRLAVQALEASQSNPASAAFSGFSETIIVRLIVGTWFGAGLSLVEVAAGVLAVVAAGTIRHQRMPRAPWIALATMMLIASWNVYRLQGEVRWIERATANASAQNPSTGSSPTASVPGPAPTTGENAGPVRVDGVYRTNIRPNSTYDYWVFRTDGECSPYSAQSDHAPPPPLPVGRRWACSVDGGVLSVVYSENGAVVRAERGAVLDRQTIVFGGVTYRFMEGQGLK
jgi:hypothetical protein